MTVSKAYALLEANGVLERQRGKGMVVSGATAVRQTTQDRLATITPALHELSRQARELGLTTQQVLAALRPLLDEERKKSD